MQGIRKQGKDSYRITVSLGKDYATGKYLKHQETFKGKKQDALKRRAELIDQFNKGIFIGSGKMTFAEYLDKWLQDYVNNNVSERTRYDYGYIVNSHIKPELGNIPLFKLHPTHLRDFYTKLLKEGRKDKKKTVGKGLSPAFVKKIHVIIHESLRHAMKWDLVYRNIADAVDPPKAKRKEVTPLSETEIDTLINSLRQSYLYVPTIIALATGMRLGEVLGLRWADVDLQGGIIEVKQAQKLKREGYGKDISYEIISGPPKSKSSRRSIDIPDSIIELLIEHQVCQDNIKQELGKYYQDNDLVCCCRGGAPIHNSSFGSDFRKAAREVGLEISFHTLRHSHASLLLKKNENLKTISARLGHSGIGITADTYIHLSPDAQKEAARKIEEILPKNL